MSGIVAAWQAKGGEKQQWIGKKKNNNLGGGEGVRWSVTGCAGRERISCHEKQNFGFQIKQRLLARGASGMRGRGRAAPARNHLGTETRQGRPSLASLSTRPPYPGTKPDLVWRHSLLQTHCTPSRNQRAINLCLKSHDCLSSKKKRES